MTPLERFYNLLSIDKKDVYQIFFYAIFSGLISLSLPLGIQAIINFIQSGKVSASWIVLIIVVVFGVILGGVLSLMQLRITENLQQKIFIRSSFEFAYRIPKIKFEALNNHYPPELANRFFDTLTIQKGTSKLLIDFSAALLQIIFGIILLSFYHPFFIVFGILLAILLYFIFKFSYKPGLESSLNESKYKYKIAAWLQEMASSNSSFKNHHHFDFALQKNDKLVTNYLSYRENHFEVIKRQFLQLVGFKVFITASLLSIGGYLVINQQMNIGQFVASEIIILLVINSVEKIIIGLETFYDVLTSVEKIGQVTDMEIEDEDTNTDDVLYPIINLQLDDVKFKFPDSLKPILDGINLTITQGDRLFVDGEDGSGKSTLFRILTGILKPNSGVFYINDETFLKMDLKQYRSHIGHYINDEMPFEGTILENITFNNSKISNSDVKWALDSVQLTSYIKTLPDGLNTQIFPRGKHISSSVAQKIMLARCIVSKPQILFLENPTDKMEKQVAREIIDFLISQTNHWTIVVSSKNKYWKTHCMHTITLKKGKITNEKINPGC